MAEVRTDQSEINARIVYWGIPGAGISANLAMIHGKLRGSNRGAVRRIKTRIDPTIEYEVLPIELGEVNGVRTHLHVVGVPGAAEQAPTRKQLLDRIDGVVFVADSRPDCMDANIASLSELVEFLSDYGCSPNDLPFVIQYNKCDLVDPFVIERLHREIQIQGAAVYEASAKTGTGILKTLTTISKLVIRHLGKREVARPPATKPKAPASPAAEAAPIEQAAPPAAAPDMNSSQTLMESAILAEAADDAAVNAEASAADLVANDVQAQFDQPWDAVSKAVKPNGGARIGADLRIVSVGDASRQNDRSISVPLVLGNDEGETITLALTIQLDPLLDGDS
jgi:signal recognition particle receptor subunit beta